MLKRLLLGVVAIGLSVSATCEQAEHRVGYFELVLEAESAYDIEAWERAIDLYGQAFQLRPPRDGDFYNAACNAALAGHSSKALVWLKSAVNSGWYNFDHLNRDVDLASLRETTTWANDLRDLKRIRENREAELNQSLRTELDEIRRADQDGRQRFALALREHGPESPEVEALKSQIKEADKENEERIVRMIDEFGWPGKSLVGSEGSQTAFLVIQHAPLEIQERILPLAREAVVRYELEPTDLALLEDRVLTRKDLPQIYGTQVRCDPKTWKDCYVLPIEDESKVNQRRASVGLGPLETYLQRWQIDWAPPASQANPPGEEGF